jgi:hypothetical protein
VKHTNLLLLHLRDHFSINIGEDFNQSGYFQVFPSNEGIISHPLFQIVDLNNNGAREN